VAELNETSIAAIVAHMNEDHGDAIAGYARRFGGTADVAVASIEAMDAAGMTLAVSLGPGQRSVRIAFDHVLQDTDDARRTLIAMAGIGADAHL